MARPARFDPERIVEVTRELVVGHGLGAATVKGIARRMGGPTGSIYHRFGSRAEILARVWLEAVTRFQSELAHQVEHSDNSPASVARFVVEWARAHPADAQILHLHRSSDFLSDAWPEEHVVRAATLRRELGSMFRKMARQWLGGARRADQEIVVLAVADLPQAALRRHLFAGTPIPKRLGPMVAEAADAIVHRATAKQTP